MPDPLGRYAGRGASADGIWRYADHLMPHVDAPFRISLGEGDTPCEPAPLAAKALGLAELRLKREDLNPTGSHKDRGVAFQLSLAVAQAHASGRRLRRIALSSSGNAAISAAAYGQAAGVGVIAFVAPGTEPGKLARLRELGAALVVTPSALTMCAEWCTARGVPNLRPSTDPAAVEGFLTLGWEILADRAERSVAADEPTEALFTFVSSATSLVGIGRAFARPGVVPGGAGRSMPALHAVQGAGGPVAAPFDVRPIAPDAPESRVGALGARKTRRLGEAQRLIRATGGGGWMITDAEADAAGRLLAASGIRAGTEAAAAIAAAGRAAAERGVRRAIVIVTGAERGLGADDGPATGLLPEVRTLGDVDRIVERDLAGTLAGGDGP